MATNALFLDRFGDFEEWAADCALVLGGVNFAEHAP